MNDNYINEKWIDAGSIYEYKVDLNSLSHYSSNTTPDLTWVSSEPGYRSDLMDISRHGDDIFGLDFTQYTANNGEITEVTLHSNFFIDRIYWFDQESIYDNDLEEFTQSYWSTKPCTFQTLKLFISEIERRIHSEDPEDKEILDISFIPMYYFTQRHIDMNEARQEYCRRNI